MCACLVDRPELVVGAPLQPSDRQVGVGAGDASPPGGLRALRARYVFRRSLFCVHLGEKKVHVKCGKDAQIPFLSASV